MPRFSTVSKPKTEFKLISTTDFRHGQFKKNAASFLAALKNYSIDQL